MSLHPTELLPGIFAVESALFIKALDMIVISDLQLGREEELRSAGHMVLDRELSSMKRRLGRILKATGAKRLLINGDLKHEFARINKQEWSQILKLFDFFQERGVEVILVKGNHDNMLLPIAQRQGFELLDHYHEDHFFFCHGHELPDSAEFKKAKNIIIGHEHPAVRFDDGVRKETAKCFLVGPWSGKAANERSEQPLLGGPWKRKSLIILPSFSQMTQGSDVLEGGPLGPFKYKRKKMSVFVIVDTAVLRFGTLFDLKTALK